MSCLFSSLTTVVESSSLPMRGYVQWMYLRFDMAVFKKSSTEDGPDAIKSSSSLTKASCISFSKRKQKVRRLVYSLACLPVVGEGYSHC